MWKICLWLCLLFTRTGRVVKYVFYLGLAIFQSHLGGDHIGDQGGKICLLLRNFWENGKFEKITILLILAQRGFLLRTESGLKFKILHRNPANTHCFHLSLAAIAVILIEHHDVSMYTMLRRLPMAQQCCWYQNIINIKVADDDDDDDADAHLVVERDLRRCRLRTVRWWTSRPSF